MKKNKPTEQLTGRINPFSRTWDAIKNLAKPNLATLLLVALLDTVFATVAIVAAIFTVIALIALLLPIPAASSFLQQPGVNAQLFLPEVGLNFWPALLLLVIMPLFIMALSSFMTGLLQKVLLESERHAKISFSATIKAVWQKLPRLWLLSLLAAGINLLVIAAIVLLFVLLARAVWLQENIVFLFTTGTAGIIALILFMIFINLRWFIYSPFIILDSDQKVTSAIRSSSAHFTQAPGFTIGLLLIAIAITGVLDFLANFVGRIDTLQIVVAIVLFLGGILIIAILALGYLDSKAAIQRQTRLKVKRGNLALAIFVCIITLALSSSNQPPDTNTPLNPFTPPNSAPPETESTTFPIQQT